MLNLYSDPEGKRIFDKSNPATAHHPTSSAGGSNQNGSDAEEVLREKDRRISELERELTLIKVRRAHSFQLPQKWSTAVFRIEWFKWCNMNDEKLTELISGWHNSIGNQQGTLQDGRLNTQE